MYYAAGGKRVGHDLAKRISPAVDGLRIIKAKPSPPAHRRRFNTGGKLLQAHVLLAASDVAHRSTPYG